MRVVKLSLTVLFSFIALNAQTGSFTLSITDADLDKVYFPGDLFSVQMQFTPMVPPDISISTVIFTSPEDATEITPVDLLDDIEEITAGSVFTISGTVKEVSATGLIGFSLSSPYIPGSPIIFPVIDSSLVEENSDKGMALTGVKIPEGDVISVPDFSDIENLYETEDSIRFVRGDMGQIAFGPGLNIIDDRASLFGLQDALQIVADLDNSIFYVEIDPFSAKFLADEEANVTLHGFPFNTASIRKSDFSMDATNESPVDEFAQSSVEILDGTVTFNVNKFSRYTAMDGGSVNIIATKSNLSENKINFSQKRHLGEISFTLKEPGSLRVEVFSLKGERVQRVETGILGTGEHSMSLETAGRSGIYPVKATFTNSTSENNSTIFQHILMGR